MKMKSIKDNPIPQGNYAPATRGGNFIYTAGMTPRKNGELILTGKIKVSESIELYREGVRQAVANALTAAVNMLKEKECIGQILSLTVYVNAEEGYTAHARLANLASEYLYEELGEAGIGSRVAVGVASLPGDAPVEIQLVALASVMNEELQE